MSAGSSVSSLSRATRVAIAAPWCAVPAFFAYKLLFNSSGPAAMACVLMIVLFGSPLVLILPALRHHPEHASNDWIVQRRLEREVAGALAAEAPEREDEPSLSSRRAPTRW
jgi:hypothetical protein